MVYATLVSGLQSLHQHSFCASPLAPLALALAGTTFCICAVVTGYFKVYIGNFAAHHGSKEPVDDFMPLLCTLTSKQEAYGI